MSDWQGERTAKVSFDQVANIFVEMAVFVSPAELQGMLCGLLANRPELSESEWLAFAAQFLERQSIEHAGATDTLTELLNQARADFSGSGFEFDMLVPDDDTELSARAEALSAWCRGFTATFAGGSDANYSAELRETLDDLQQIAQLDQDLEDNDSNEADFTELFEFVRMAAILVYSELNQPDTSEGKNDEPPVLH